MSRPKQSYEKWIRANTDGTFQVFCNIQDGVEDCGACKTYAEAIAEWDKAMFAYNNVPIPDRGTKDNRDPYDVGDPSGGPEITDDMMEWAYGRLEAWEKEANDDAHEQATNGRYGDSERMYNRAKAMGGVRAYFARMRNVILHYRSKYPQDHA